MHIFLFELFQVPQESIKVSILIELLYMCTIYSNIMMNITVTFKNYASLTLKREIIVA